MNKFIKAPAIFTYRNKVTIFLLSTILIGAVTSEYLNAEEKHSSKEIYINKPVKKQTNKHKNTKT